MPEWFVRLATEHDLPQLERIEAESWDAYTRPDTPQPGQWGIRIKLDDTLLAVTPDGDVWGYATVTHRTSLAANRHVGRLAALAVSPAVRRRGVGAALLASAEDLARRRGQEKIVLTVLGCNLTAQRLYERAGYREEGRLVGEFELNGVRVDDIWLSKWLNPA